MDQLAIYPYQTFCKRYFLYLSGYGIHCRTNCSVTCRRISVLLTSLHDHVLTITLNRPEKKNALNPPMLAELAFALAYAHYSAEVWLVVLAASGDTFCAGMDLKSLSLGDAETDHCSRTIRPGSVGRVNGGVA